MTTVYAICEFPGLEPESHMFHGGLPAVGSVVGTASGTWVVAALTWFMGSPTVHLEPAPENKVARLRETQAFAASAAAGPLLDAWEALGRDTRDDPLLAGVAEAVAKLRQAMECE